MTKIIISGDLPIWFLGQANRLVKVMNEILLEDLNVYIDNNTGELFIMTDDELGIKPNSVQIMEEWK